VALQFNNKGRRHEEAGMFYLGLFLFFGVHGLMLIQPIRQRAQTVMQPARYLGVFSLMSLLGIVLIVAGYDRNIVFKAPVVPWVQIVSPGVMFVAFWMLVAANVPGWTKHWVQHPMTLGVSLWALTHLAVNPNQHAWLMFGCFFVLVVVSAVTASARQKNKPSPAPRLLFDGLTLILASTLTGAVYAFHSTLFGVGLS